MIIDPLERPAVRLAIIDQQALLFAVQNYGEIGNSTAQMMDLAVWRRPLPRFPQIDVALCLVGIGQRPHLDAMPPVIGPATRPRIPVLKSMNGMGNRNGRKQCKRRL